MEIKLVYSLEDDLIKFKKIVGNSFKYTVYDENAQKDYKKASLLKYTAGAKLTPFIAVYKNNIMHRCFYQENKGGCLEAFTEYFGQEKTYKDKILDKLKLNSSIIFIDNFDLSKILNVDKLKTHIINEIENEKK